ncbi:MAG: hypothetical protein K8T26_07300 [Lentisphaerae bacterium]|nr:hypothetical protein [Lentisphaerota bacterium]
MRQADVTSIEALSSFRAHFLSYLVEAGLAVDQASEEITRTRLWLQHDQRLYWEREYRRRTGLLAQARQQLLTARLMPEFRSADTARRDFHRAERALREAEEKLARVKQEAMRFDSTVAPKLKELDGLRMFLTGEGAKAAAFLSGAVEALQAYAETRPVTAAPAPPAPSHAPEADGATPLGSGDAT